MINEILIANQPFIMGIITSIIVWALFKWTGARVQKSKITQLLMLILDIIQDIKNNPDNAELDDNARKQLAIEVFEQTVQPKKQTILKRVFGTVGGAVEFVFHNKKVLGVAIGALLKRVF